MSASAEVDVSLLGGPLHRLGRRLRLVRGQSNTVNLGLALGFSIWLVFLLLALVRNFANDFFRIEMIAVHLRFLVIIPLFFICESMFDPEVRGFVRSLVTSEIVPEEERPALMNLIDRVRWRNDALVPDVVCFIAALMTGSTRTPLTPHGVVVPIDPSFALAKDPVLVTFYFTVALTVFRFLLFRWIWRFALWFLFLWKLSRLRLRLIAGHSDRAAGLGGLEIVQLHLIPFVFAVAILNSGTLAAELSRGLNFNAVYAAGTIGLLIGVAVIFGPLSVFTPKLIETRYRGFYRYMALATRYVKEFEDRWLSGKPSDIELLGAADFQSLADLTSGVDIVREMRVVPAGLRLLWVTAAACLVPLLPLWLFQYSLTDLLQKSMARLLGG